MHNINIIHWSFFPTALPHRLPFLFPFPCLSFPYPAYLLALPISLTCPCLLPSAFAYFLCLFPLLLPVSLPCLIPCPAYFLDLPMPTFFCLCLLLCLFPLPVSLPCLLLCPAYFLSLPFSLPCLLLCPTYRSTFFNECMLHGYIASHSLLIAYVCIYVYLYLTLCSIVDFCFLLWKAFKNLSNGWPRLLFTYITNTS